MVGRLTFPSSGCLVNTHFMKGNEWMNGRYLAIIGFWSDILRGGMGSVFMDGVLECRLSPQLLLRLYDSLSLMLSVIRISVWLSQYRVGETTARTILTVNIVQFDQSLVEVVMW